MARFFPRVRPDGPGGSDREVEQPDDGESGDSKEEGKGDDLQEAKVTNYQSCYELAGIIGVDPRQFTLRKLVWMSQAYERSEWNRAATIVVKLHNTHVTSESQLIKFQDVHPHFMVGKPQQAEPTARELAILEREIKGY